MRPHRNITKTIQHKYVRPMRRRNVQLKVDTSLISDKKEVINEIPIIEEIKEEKVEQKETNKEEIKKEDMNTIDVNQVNAILQAEEETKLPKRKVKVEKKDKGLFERTENSRVILTEDNKMLLND